MLTYVEVTRGSLSLSWPLVVTLLPQRVAVAVNEAKAMPRREPGEPVYEEAREGLFACPSTMCP